MKEMGWNEPTPVQCEAVPAGIAGNDLIVKAQTGTGKTGAYAMIVMSRTGKGRDHPSTLVITPTRELAMQVDTELRKLSRGTGHTSTAVYGGAPIDRQIVALRRGTDIVVGTPGRLKDMIERDALDLSEITEVVLDEADRMLDMGFEEDLDFIMEHVPEKRHSLMFSATISPEIQDLAENMLDDPDVIDISGDTPTTGLTRQYLVRCKRNEKKEALYEILLKGTPKVIVFFATKVMVDTVYQELKADGAKVGTLHGDMPQKLRERVIGEFRDNRITILLATDVAARGLDVRDVDLVVNFDLPTEPETYLHRIGRTGRAGKEGISISLVNPRDRKLVRMCEDEADEAMEEVTLDQLEPIDAVHEPVPKERPKKENKMKVEKHRNNRRERKAEEREGYATLEINLGRNDGLSRGDIADLIRKHADLPEDAVGKVGLKDDISFVEISLDHSDYVLENLVGLEHNGKAVTFVPAPVKERTYSDEEDRSFDRRRENRYKNYVKRNEEESEEGSEEATEEGEESEGSEEKRPYNSDRNGYGHRDRGDRSYRGRDERPRYHDRERSDRPYRDRRDGDRPYRQRDDRRPYGDRSGYGGRRGGYRDRDGDRSRRDHGDRPYRDRDEKPRYHDREERSYGDRDEKPRYHDHDEKPYGDRDEKPRFHDRDEKPRYRDRGDRPYRDRDERPRYHDREDSGRGDRGRPYGHGDRGYGGRDRRQNEYRDRPRREHGDRPYRDRDERPRSHDREHSDRSRADRDFKPKSDAPKRYPSNRDTPKRYPSNRDTPKKKRGRY